MTQPHPSRATAYDDFEELSESGIWTYLKRNQAFVSPNDKTSTPAERRVTANSAASRRAAAYEVAKAEAERLDQAMSEANEVLQRFPKGPLGLTPDDVKRSPEWVVASSNFARTFQALRKFNSTYTKTFADELRHERQIRRAAGLTAG